MNFIDSHAHMQTDLFPDDLAGVIAHAQEAGVLAIVSIGTSLRESQQMLELAKKYPGYIFPTVGLHPFDALQDTQALPFTDLEEQFRQLAQSPGVVALGECGLDYGKTDQSISPSDQLRQETLFRMQIVVATELNLPLVVHCRNAWQDTFRILSHFKGRVILHSFTGDSAIVTEAISHGYFISLSGITTFSNARALQEAAAKVPHDLLLLETDSPFLAPEPVRGTRNEPKNIVYTAQFVAKLLAIPVEKLASITEENTKKVFHLAL